jgi:hypothetical protein
MELRRFRLNLSLSLALSLLLHFHFLSLKYKYKVETPEGARVFEMAAFFHLPRLSVTKINTIKNR